MTNKIIQADSVKYLSERKLPAQMDLIFLDSPFNQGKAYKYFNEQPIVS